jgi:hypothetical protein
MYSFYTYRIKWTALNLSYYGVRYKENEYTSALMTTYFTSSSYVRATIEKHGLPDLVEIRKTFDTKLAAKKWEERVISKGKLYKSPLWLNKGNNNAFRDVVMDSDIRAKISENKRKAHEKTVATKGKRKMYNNGTESKLYYESDVIPDGWVLGIIKSQKQIDHSKKLHEYNKNMPPEVRAERSRRQSEATRGKKKPDGFGAKVSKASRGKSKPWQAGDKNVSKREDVKEKISKSWENRELGVWYTNKETNTTIYAKKSEYSYEDLEKNGFIRSKPPKGKWFNDGSTDIWVRDDSVIDTSNLISGRIKIEKCWYTNGIESKSLSKDEPAPAGWVRGRLKSGTGKGKYYHNEEGMLFVKNGEDVPNGYVIGKGKRRADTT